MNTLPSNLLFSLRWFSQGNHIDLCINICNQFGRLLPSEPVGQIIKKSQIQALLVRGFLEQELTNSYGISYWRIQVSEAGKQHFEEHNND